MVVTLFRSRLTSQAGDDYIAMADGMSADLKPLVTQLNAILVGDARGARRTVHRWGRI